MGEITDASRRRPGSRRARGTRTAGRMLLRGLPGLGGLCLLLGCSGAPPAISHAVPSPTGLTVTVTATSCGTRWPHPAAGLQTFQIHNASRLPVEVSLTNAQTGGVYDELEAIGPGTTRPMQASLTPGSYAFVCDADGGARITGPTVVVPGSADAGGNGVVPPDIQGTLTAITADRAYLTTGLAAAAQQVSVLAADIAAGQLTQARGAWLTAHLTYERLGSAYGQFSGYDDAINGSPDGLPGGVSDPSFTGFYRIEYGLWHGQTATQLTGPAQRLEKDIQSLRTALTGFLSYPQAALSDLALRTHEILEHTIRFQLTGADDFGSGTTLATTAANIEAVRAQLDMLKPLLTSRYPDLTAAYSWLDRLQRLVAAQHQGSGWKPVTSLTTRQHENINAAAAQTVQLLAPVAVLLESRPLP